MTKNNNKLKVAVIGLGHQSLEDHIPAILASQDVELVSVVDIDHKKLKNFLQNNSTIRGYNNIDYFFKKEKKEKVDFIVLAVPHYLHYNVTMEAIRNKIHVLKEKPFAITINEAKKIKEFSNLNNIKVGVTLQRRFNPIYSTFFQLIDKIGVPFYVEIKYTFFTDKPGDGWRGKKKFAGGGCLIDMGYHMIDLLIWYFGLPDEVLAETSCLATENCTYNAEDTTHILFKYSKTGLWGSLFVSRVIHPKQEFINVYGTRGIIVLQRGKIQRYSCTGELQESLERQDSWPSAAQDQIEYFVKVIKGFKENISNPDFHLNHMAFIAAAYKSKEEKRYINPNNLT